MKKLFKRIIDFFKIHPSIKIETIYHELGHTFFAYVLNKYFVYREINLREVIVDGESLLGTARVTGRKPTEFAERVEYRIHSIIILYAGMCCENILKENYLSLDEKIINWINSPDEYLNSNGGGGDMELIGRNYPLIDVTMRMEPYEFRRNIFNIIFSVLRTEVVFNGLKNYSQKIYDLNELFISRDSITAEFEENGIESFIETHRENYYRMISETFPIENTDMYF